MKIDTIVNDDDLIEFLSEQYKQTNNLNFIAAAYAIELYRRNNEILSWQLAQDKWVSVEERLPKKDGWYFVVLNNYNSDVCQYSVERKSFGIQYSDKWSGDDGEVTHWIAIPTPPTEKEN